MAEERGMRRKTSDMWPSLIPGCADPWCPWLAPTCDLNIVGDTQPPVACTPHAHTGSAPGTPKAQPSPLPLCLVLPPRAQKYLLCPGAVGRGSGEAPGVAGHTW